MAVLDIQRRSQQIGRIRIGQQVKAANGKSRPDRLTTFRFTTPSERTAHAIADLYGGTVGPWEKQFEVITERSEIGVTVPPRDAVISQWYEMWGKTIKRRCDSQREQLSEGECLCPHAKNPGDEEEVKRCALERARLAKLNPAEACSLVTRINVMIPDLPGLGVFRLDTGSFHAAGESGDKADLMEMAREQNLFLPANLRIEWRVRTTDAKPYPVPVLEISETFRAIASGALEAAGIMAQLPPAPGEQRLALTAATPATPATASVAVPEGFDAELAAITEMDIATAGQQLVALMSDPAITPAQMNALKTRALDLGVWEDQVCTDDGEHETWEEVHSAWQTRWDALALAAKARRQPGAGDAQDRGAQ